MRLVALLCVVILTACGAGGAGGADAPAADPIGEYIDDYGGSREVYGRIIGSRDCDFLQDEFDQAAANNDMAEPGTPQHKQTLGYMSAALDRMESVGC